MKRSINHVALVRKASTAALLLLLGAAGINLAAESPMRADGAQVHPREATSAWTGESLDESSVGTFAGRKFAISVMMGDDLGHFEDCLSFGPDGVLDLQASQGLVIGWMLDMDGARAGRFSAVTSIGTPTANAFGLALHGALRGRDFIDGNMVNDLGLTFMFTGRENVRCDIGLLRYAFGGPYGTAPLSPGLYKPTPQSLAGRQFTGWMFDGATESACLAFTLSGRLDGYASTSLLWRMDGLDSAEGTFQALGPMGGPDAGLALHGQLMPWGALHIRGISSDAKRAHGMIGTAIEARNCITQ